MYCVGLAVRPSVHGQYISIRPTKSGFHACFFIARLFLSLLVATTGVGQWLMSKTKSLQFSFFLLFFLFFLPFSLFFFFCFFSLFFCLQMHNRDGLHNKMDLQLKALKARTLRRWSRQSYSSLYKRTATSVDNAFAVRLAGRDLWRRISPFVVLNDYRITISLCKFRRYGRKTLTFPRSKFPFSSYSLQKK